MKNFVFVFATLFICVVAGDTLHAQIPRTLSYQGVLTDNAGKPRPDGSYSFTFRFYTSPTGGTAIWSESKSLPVKSGLFSTVLGEQTPFGTAVKFDKQYWLGIQVGNEPELSPRIALTSVGYSFSSLRADTAMTALVSLIDTVEYAQRVKTIDGAKGGNINGNVAIQDNLWISSWEDHYLELADSRKRIRSTKDPDGALIFYVNSEQIHPRFEFRNMTDESVAATIHANGNASFSGNLWVGSWNDHSIEIADSRKRIRSTADPDGALIFYVNSEQFRPRFEFRNVKDESIAATIHANGNASFAGSLWLGSWADHELTLADSRKAIRSTADPDGALIFYTHSDQINPRWEFRDMRDQAIRASINGNNGDGFFQGRLSTRVLEIRGGSDLAEPFEISESQPIPKGALVIIDEENPGQLKLSHQAYDKRVAGVVSGAGGINPGLTLTQEGVMEGGQNVALSGRVYALATAANGPIKPGDLLTTSNVPGHAMKATDRERWDGAVIGKAMSSLETGAGLVLVLVNLQ